MIFLFVIGIVHVLISPYTKVEESFNIQAVHDMLFYKTHLFQYDHFDFPGVVPRSFIGGIIITVLCVPFASVFHLLELDRIYYQYLFRIILSVLYNSSLLFFSKSFSKRFSHVPGLEAIFSLVCSSQFHLMFYSSRPLPNTFAACLVNIALGYWLKGDAAIMTALLAFATCIFRCDMIVLALPLIVIAIIKKPSCFRRVFLYGLIASLAAITLSVLIDSFFWNKWIWPEGEVLYYNVVLDKSSNWGTSSWHWYFTSVLPRALFSCIILIPLACIQVKFSIRNEFLPAVFFVGLYSRLPHKELRFIYPSFPLFLAVASVAFSKIWFNNDFHEKKPEKKWPNRVVFMFRVFLCLLILVNICCTVLFTIISSHNYPGGEALSRANEIACDNHLDTIHIGNLAAISGASRFGQSPLLVYSKEEHLSSDDMVFDVLISEVDNIPGYILLDHISMFKNIDWSSLRIVIEPVIYLLKKIS